MDIKIKKSNFLKWYFSGSDQEQYEISRTLGSRVKESLEEGQSSIITTEDLWNEVYQGGIPAYLFEGFEKESDVEYKDIEFYINRDNNLILIEG